MIFFSFLTFFFILSDFFGQTATVTPIQVSLAEEARSGTLTLLSSASTVINSRVYFNSTYSRPFPSGLNYTFAACIIDLYRTITTAIIPVEVIVLPHSSDETDITISYYCSDTYTSRLRVSYLTINSNYISSAFNIIHISTSNYSISSSSSYTYLFNTPIDTNGGWNVAVFPRTMLFINSPASGFSFRISVTFNGTSITSFIITSYYPTNTDIDFLNFWIVFFGYSATQSGG